MLEGTACKTLIETYQASKNKEKILEYATKVHKMRAIFKRKFKNIIWF